MGLGEGGFPESYNWGNMLWSAKRYWQIFTDKREKKPSEKHEVAKPPSVFHEVFSRVWSEYLKFCWAKLSILPLFLVFWSPQPTVMNTGKYPTLLSVLWRRKTWNTVAPACKVSVLSSENWPYKRADLTSRHLFRRKTVVLAVYQAKPNYIFTMDSNSHHFDTMFGIYMQIRYVG